MCRAHNEGWEKTEEGIELYINQESNGTLGEKKKVLGNLGKGHNQTIQNKIFKNQKRVPHKNKKTSRKQSLYQGYHQSNKNLDYPLCKMLGTISKMVNEGTQRNGPKKLMTIPLALHPRMT